MNKYKHMLIVSASVAIASQFYVNFFVQGFIITLSVIIFPILLSSYKDLHPIKTALFTSIVSPLFRGIITYLSIKELDTTFRMIYPDMFFYISYGIIFYFLYYRYKQDDLTKFITSIMFCDFLSNIVEMSIRTRIVGLNLNIIRGLLLIALVRSVFVLSIIIFMKSYKSFLSKEEHEARYRRLVLLTSKYKSETYFMYKNMAEIEDVMKKSYTLYTMVSDTKYDENLKKLVLDIAKDVHEIKKDYLRSIKGLEELSLEKVNVNYMHISDMIQILEIDAKENIHIRGLNIKTSFFVDASFYVKEHFYLMSVLRNLIQNSIEALEDKQNGELTLHVFEACGEYIFRVTDNGMGIKKGNLSYIFNPGFSTKFHKTTGDICRGIGLTLARDLVQNQFSGSIDVESEEGLWTAFFIRLPVSTFIWRDEVEILHCG